MLEYIKHLKINEKKALSLLEFLLEILLEFLSYD